MPAGKPDAERDERAPRQVGAAAGRARRERPASGPNSGPTTIAPTIRIGWSSRMPTARDLHRQHHEGDEADRELRRSRWCAARPPPRPPRRTAGPARPARRRPPASESARVDVSTAIEPTRGISSSLRSPMITLASSRATSQRIRSPSGFWAAPCRCTTLRTAGEPQSSSSAWSARSFSGRRSAGAASGRLSAVAAPSPARTRPGSRRFCIVAGSTNTWRSSPSASTSPSARARPPAPSVIDVVADARDLRPRGRSRRRSGRRPGSGCAPRRPPCRRRSRSSRRSGADRLAPELRHREVEVGEVVRVEDDALKVALVEAHAHPVAERLGHAPDARSGRCKQSCSKWALPSDPRRTFPNTCSPGSESRSAPRSTSSSSSPRSASTGWRRRPYPAPRAPPPMLLARHRSWEAQAFTHCALRSAAPSRVGATGSTPVATPAARRLMRPPRPGRRARRRTSRRGKPATRCSGDRRRPTDAAPAQPRTQGRPRGGRAALPGRLARPR